MGQNAKEAQRARLLEHLQMHGSIATTEAREMLACMHPAGRVAELRAQGLDIATVWRHVADADGVVHRQGVYVLQGGQP